MERSSGEMLLKKREISVKITGLKHPFDHIMLYHLHFTTDKTESKVNTILLLGILSIL